MARISRSTKPEVLNALKNVPLFSQCSKRELSLLAGIAEEEEYETGETICAEGDTDLGLHVIVEGEATAKVGGRARRQMGPGAFFGEVALLDGRPRSATVMADAAVRVLVIPAWSFNQVLQANARLAMKMLQEVAGRLRENDAVSPAGEDN